MYTRLEEVIHFVFKAFKGKKRIKEDIDLSFHSICVGTMLKEIGMNEDIVITGYLHDIIEDTNYDYEYLKNKYGEVIASNVMYLSENRSIKDFKERKLEFINRLDSQDNDELIVVEIADKLHNLLSDYELYKKMMKKLPLNKDGIVISYLHNTTDLIKEVFNDKRVTFEEYKPYGGMMVYKR